MINIDNCTKEELLELFSYYMDICVEHPCNPRFRKMLNLISKKILEIDCNSENEYEI